MMASNSDSDANVAGIADDTSTACTLTVTRLPGPLGVEVTGLQSSAVAAALPQLKRLFREQRLIVLRNQQDTDETTFQRLAEAFGPLETSYVMRRADGEVSQAVHFIQNLDAQGQVVANAYGNANYFWHTDKQYHRQPSLLTMLQAIQLPPSGGDTEFADMAAAYDALPAAMKQRLEGLQAVYSYAHMLRTCLNREASDEERTKAPPLTHPLVRTTPETGRKSLFLGMYCSGIVGMQSDEAQQLIHQLHQQATLPHNVYRHIWQPGDLLFWDNRSLLHRAISNFAMATQRRVLRRAVVRGEIPV